MRVNAFCDVSLKGVAHYALLDSVVYAVVIAERHEGMAGVVGSMSSYAQLAQGFIDKIHVGMSRYGADATGQVGHDEVIKFTKDGNAIEIFDERHDALCYGDGTITASSGFHAAYHVPFIQVHVVQLDGSQFGGTEAGVALDEDDFHDVQVGVLPQGSHFCSGKWFVQGRRFYGGVFDVFRVVFGDQVICHSIVIDDVIDGDKALLGASFES